MHPSSSIIPKPQPVSGMACGWRRPDFPSPCHVDQQFLFTHAPFSHLPDFSQFSLDMNVDGVQLWLPPHLLQDGQDAGRYPHLKLISILTSSPTVSAAQKRSTFYERKMEKVMVVKKNGKHMAVWDVLLVSH